MKKDFIKTRQMPVDNDVFTELEEMANEQLYNMAAGDAIEGKDTKHYPDVKKALESILTTLKAKYQPEQVKNIENDPAV